MHKIKLIFASVAVFSGLTATSAIATPIAPVPARTTSSVEQVRWVCGSYGRCWWQPNYYGAYAYYPHHRYWRHHHWGRRYWRHHHHDNW